MSHWSLGIAVLIHTVDTSNTSFCGVIWQKCCLCVFVGATRDKENNLC